MRHKKMKKFSALALGLCMAAGLMPLFIKPLVVSADTGTNIAPSVYQFATKDQLMNNFDLADSTTDKAVQNVIFGQTGSGTAQEWFIAGKDPAIESDNIVLFATSPLMAVKIANYVSYTPIRFQEAYHSEDDFILTEKAQTDYTYAEDSDYSNTSDVYCNHYGASMLRSKLKELEKNTDYFNPIEQLLMNKTTITTYDTKNEVTYNTTDKLYAAYGDDNSRYITVGTNNSESLNSGLTIDASHWSIKDFWLRTPDNHFLGSTALKAYVDLGDNYSQYVIYDATVMPNYVVPAFDLNLSPVIFASAVPVVTFDGELSTNRAMTLRYAGSSPGIATYNTARVVVADAKEGTYLVVQNSEGAWAQCVNGNATVEASNVTINGKALTSFDNCKVWLERSDSNYNVFGVPITYAKLATQVEGVNVAITRPSDSHITISSVAGNGAETQNDMIGAMDSVIYTTDKEYCFPANYNLDSSMNSNGITVTRDSDSQITVSGTPTDNTTITLATATARTYTISIDKPTYDFGSKNPGYIQPSVETFTVTNTGNSKVTFVPTLATDYIIGTFSSTELAPNATASFTVQPEANLITGTHNFPFTVLADHCAMALVRLSFKVNRAFSVIINPVSASITDGDSQSLEAMPEGGSGEYTYKWYKGSETTEFGTNKSVSVSPTENTTYKVVVNDTIEDKEETATVSVTPKPVEANPVAGTYTSNQSVTLSSSTEGAEIYYTTDGGAPSKTNGTKYAGAISVTGTEGQNVTTTIKAIAVKPKMQDSGVETFKYEINIPDTTVPTAKIKIGSNDWISFWNTVTFGLFFKNMKEVTITAADNVTENPGIEYYLSDGELTEEQAKAITDWIVYTEKFTLFKSRKKIIYAKVTDQAGNLAIINSEGIVVYEDAQQVTEAITYIKNVSGDLTADEKLNGNTVKSINDGTKNLAAETDYTVDAEGKITFKNTYLSPLAIKSTPYTMTISYNPLGETYKSAKDNDAPADKTIALTVRKPKLSEITAPTAITGVANGTVKDATALGLPATVTIATEDTSVTSANVTWNLKTLANGSYDPDVLTEQIFTVNGTVTLPDVIDADGKSLEITISVTVSAADVVDVPIANPAAGIYTSNQSVTLSSSTEGAEIYYTTDGGAPSKTNGTKYAGAFSVTGTEGQNVTTTIKAVAVKPKMQDSGVETFKYGINIPATTYAVNVTNGVAKITPSITTQPSNATVISGQKAKLIVNSDDNNPDYKITFGANSTWIAGTDGTLTIRGNGELSKFVCVKVDGVVVDSSNYTTTSGSTIITFKKSYLDTLSKGIHTFEMEWKDGTASTIITVKEASTSDNNENGNTDNMTDTTETTSHQTGDHSPILLWIFILLALGVGVGTIAVKEVKRRRNNS